jgi:hypothetical protein
MDKWIAPLIGGVRLRELGRARVRHFRAEMLDRGAANATANGVMRVLSTALGAGGRGPCEGLEIALSRANANARGRIRTCDFWLHGQGRGLVVPRARPPC